MQAEWFEEFARSLLKEKGVNVPDEEVQKQLVKDISVRARDVVLSQLIDDMNEKELKELELATNSSDQKTVDRLISLHQEVITTTLAQFKGMYLQKR